MTSIRYSADLKRTAQHAQDLGILTRQQFAGLTDGKVSDADVKLAENVMAQVAMGSQSGGPNAREKQGVALELVTFAKAEYFAGIHDDVSSVKSSIASLRKSLSFFS